MTPATPDATLLANRDGHLRGHDRRVLRELVELAAEHPDEPWHPLHAWLVASKLLTRALPQLPPGAERQARASITRLARLGYLEIARVRGRRGRLYRLASPGPSAEARPAASGDSPADGRGAAA